LKAYRVVIWNSDLQDINPESSVFTHDIKLCEAWDGSQVDDSHSGGLTDSWVFMFSGL